MTRWPTPVCIHIDKNDLVGDIILCSIGDQEYCKVRDKVEAGLTTDRFEFLRYRTFHHPHCANLTVHAPK